MAAKDSSKRKGNLNGGESNKKQKQEDSETKSSSAQKRELKKERQSHRRHAETVAEAKVLWNKLRMKSNTTEEKNELMERVMKMIRGKINEIALQHDASRVVQAAVQFGSAEQRKEILSEICEKPEALVELSKIQYAHFLSLKIIKCCNRDKDCVKLIVKSFKGSMPKLAVHAVGARVVESIFLNIPAKETASLKQEFYGPHFSLFARDLPGIPTLESNLKNATTENQKVAAISFVKDIVTKGTTKSFFGFTFFQELLAEYIDVIDPSEIRDLASSVADHSIHLLSTRAGVRAVSSFASYGTPRDRKRICKSIKGYTSSSLLHRDAYLAIIRLVQVTDDTVSVHKSVLNEILKSDDDVSGSEKPLLFDLATSDTASKFFLFLLSGDAESRMKYFDPYERSILEPIPEIKGVCTSKKDPEARRQEVLKHIYQDLIDLCINHTEALLLSLPGSRVLKEVYMNYSSEKLVRAILEVCESGLSQSKENERLSLFEDPIGHRAIKNLILCDAQRGTSLFSEAFLTGMEERLTSVAESNRGAFVLASLFKVKSVQPKVQKILRSEKKEILEMSKRNKTTAGYDALLKEIA
eukprot:scaffold4343_cov144-Cylindrotheca_fusiformis.AAC.8